MTIKEAETILRDTADLRWSNKINQAIDVLMGTDYPEEEVGIRSIAEVVSAEFDASLPDMRSESRQRGIIEARQTAMYLARNLKGYTHKRIGAFFGKDHSTCVVSCSKIEQFIQTDPIIREKVERCMMRINSTSQEPLTQQR